MFFISKLVTSAFLPPGIFILAFAVAGLLALLGKRRASAILAICGTVLLLAFSLTPVADALILPLENRYAPLSLGEGGAIAIPQGLKGLPVVVLGGGEVDSSPEEGGHASLRAEPMKRLAYGIRVAQGCGGKIVFSGGLVFGPAGAESEADAARRFIEGGGYGVQAVYEGGSRTTAENALNVASLVGARRVVLVTSAYHMPRAVASFERRGMQVVPAPTDYQADRTAYGLSDFLPSIEALGRSWKALHEYAGLAGYAISGR
jgi:uncharacterized SAM-binding protein YcdF (DUF218 family)